MNHISKTPWASLCNSFSRAIWMGVEGSVFRSSACTISLRCMRPCPYILIIISHDVTPPEGSIFFTSMWSSMSFVLWIIYKLHQFTNRWSCLLSDSLILDFVCVWYWAKQHHNKKKGVPNAVGFPHCAGSGEGLFLSPKPYPHKCAEAGARQNSITIMTEK